MRQITALRKMQVQPEPTRPYRGLKVNLFWYELRYVPQLRGTGLAGIELKETFTAFGHVDMLTTLAVHNPESVRFLSARAV